MSINFSGHRCFYMANKKPKKTSFKIEDFIMVLTQTDQI